MKYGLPFILAGLLLSLFIAACGGETADTSATATHISTADGGEAGSHTDSGTATGVPDSEASNLTGVWDIVTENGSPPAANGYNSLVLTLTADTFSSAYDGTAGTCTWSGSYTATATTLTIVTDAATGPPCDIAVGSTKTAQVTLSADGNTLTLDWTAEPMGTLQEYTRVH